MAAASSLSIGWGVVVIVVVGVHLTMSAPFRPDHKDPYPAGYPRRPRGGRGHRVPVPAAFPLPALAFWSSCSRRGIGRSLRSAYQCVRRRDWTSTGFPCFARTSCDRGGCPLYSGDHGARPDRSRSPASARRITAARPCTPPRRRIYAELCITKHHQGFTRVHPSDLPLACGSRMQRQRLGLYPELRTPPLRATHVEVGTGHRART